MVCFTARLTFLLLCVSKCAGRVLLLCCAGMSTALTYANRSIEVICKQHELKEQESEGASVMEGSDFGNRL